MAKRVLNYVDEEIKRRLKSLQLFVNDKMRANEISDMKRSQALVDDLQLLHHIWTKDENSM